MEVRDESGLRVVLVERQAVAEVLLLARATGWEVVSVTTLPPDDRSKVTMTQ